MDSEAATASHIKEMVQELVQQEGVEATATELPQEGAIIEVGETSTPQVLPEHLSSADPPLGKEILIFLNISFYCHG